MRASSLLFAALPLAGCIPDFTDDAYKGDLDGTGEGIGEEDDTGAGVGGDDGGREDGGDGGDDAGGSGPDWIGNFDAGFVITTPRGDTLCAGTFPLTVDEGGGMTGVGECAMEAGPGAGQVAPLRVDAVGLEPTEDVSPVDGVVILELPTPDGSDARSAPATGAASPDGISLTFDVPVGPNGDQALHGEISTN
jgi:hypothetical protein